MTTFKCTACGGHWQEGPTRDMREDVTCRKCLDAQLKHLKDDHPHSGVLFMRCAALERERDELVETLRDTIMVAAGPCQVPLRDRCRCWRCVNQRVDAILSRHPIPKANG